MRREKVEELAKRIIYELKPYCKKIKVAGSIRRKEKTAHKDIDIVLIPKNRIKLENYMKTRGKFLEGGTKKSWWKVEGVKIELYYTTLDEWGATLLAYSSKKGSAIGLRVIAKEMGYKLNNHGLFKGTKRIAGKTEREIYEALGRPYKKPENR